VIAVTVILSVTAVTAFPIDSGYVPHAAIDLTVMSATLLQNDNHKRRDTP
jgi:hypothetical protein